MTTAERCSVFAHLAQEGHKSSQPDDKSGVRGLVSNVPEGTSRAKVQMLVLGKPDLVNVSRVKLISTNVWSMCVC